MGIDLDFLNYTSLAQQLPKFRDNDQQSAKIEFGSFSTNIGGEELYSGPKMDPNFP